MPIFSSRSFKDHEQIVFCSDKKTGLKAIIAVHSTALGPAAGGCRFWDYTAKYAGESASVASQKAEADAIDDVLRLSRGMSYKNAMAGLRLGGGKSVIIGDPRKISNADLASAFGAHVQKLGGTYFTAEDVGTSTSFMEQVHKTTDYVCGLENGPFATGDPSPHTALGVYVGMKAAAQHKFGNDSLKGKHIAIQGVGNVGRRLAQHLLSEGALLTIADINEDNINRVLTMGDVKVGDIRTIHTTDCDIFAPCALGGAIHDGSVNEFKAQIIAGAANNQLDVEGVHDEALRKRDILYCPDYVINAGGIIAIEAEIYKEHQSDQDREAMVRGIGGTLTNIFKESDATDLPTGVVANKIAEKIIADARTKK